MQNDKKLDELLTNINIKPNTGITNEDFSKFLYFIDPTHKKLNPYKKGIIEELELPEKNPKEKQIEKPKEISPFMQVSLGNKTFFKPTTHEAINELKTEPTQLKTYGVDYFLKNQHILDIQMK